MPCQALEQRFLQAACRAGLLRRLQTLTAACTGYVSCTGHSSFMQCVHGGLTETPLASDTLHHAMRLVILPWQAGRVVLRRQYRKSPTRGGSATVAVCPSA